MTKQIIAILLSIIIAIYPPLAYASASTSWTAQSVKQIGSKVTIEAIKNNAKSVITTVPSSKAVSSLLRGGAGQLALSFAIDKMLDATDWVLDPANNAVRYKTTNAGWEYVIDGRIFTSVEQACKHVWSDDFLKRQGYKRARRNTGSGNAQPGDYYQKISWLNSYEFRCHVNIQYYNSSSITYDWITYYDGRKLSTGTVDERSVSLDHVAEQVINNAAAGNVQSQQAVKEATIQAVKAGEYDTQLQKSAVAINGADGVDGVDGKDGEKGKDGKDGKNIPKLDVSGIINAISSMANRITTTLGITNAKIDSVVIEQQDIKRVINTSTDTIIDIERETQARISDVVSSTDAVGAKVDQQGKLINDNIDKVIDQVKITGDIINTQTDAITTAIEGLDFGLSEDVINDAVDRVIKGQADQSTVINEAVERILQEQAKNTAEQTKQITDAISNQTDVINDKSKANTDRIVEAIEATKDKIREEEQEKAKPFELPEFCDWAKEVCDFMEDEKPDNTEIDLHEQLPRQVDTSIRFGGHCPADVTIDGVVFGQNISFTLMNFNSLCFVLSNYVKPIVIMMASYSAVMILGGRNESG